MATTYRIDHQTTVSICIPACMFIADQIVRGKRIPRDIIGRNNELLEDVKAQIEQKDEGIDLVDMAESGYLSEYWDKLVASENNEYQNLDWEQCIEAIEHMANNNILIITISGNGMAVARKDPMYYFIDTHSAGDARLASNAIILKSRNNKDITDMIHRRYRGLYDISAQENGIYTCDFMTMVPKIPIDPKQPNIVIDPLNPLDMRRDRAPAPRAHAPHAPQAQQERAQAPRRPTQEHPAHARPRQERLQQNDALAEQARFMGMLDLKEERAHPTPAQQEWAREQRAQQERKRAPAPRRPTQEQPAHAPRARQQWEQPNQRAHAQRAQPRAQTPHEQRDPPVSVKEPKELEMMVMIATKILNPLLGVKESLSEKMQRLIDDSESTWAITSAIETSDNIEKLHSIENLLGQLQQLSLELYGVQKTRPSTDRIIESVLDALDETLPLWQVELAEAKAKLAQQHGGNHVQYTTHKHKYRCLVADI
jgi:hypothetical protein